MNPAQMDAFKLVGITVRTNNQNEANPDTAKISPIVMKYFHNQMADQIKDKAKPGVTICAYTEYESDHTGEYTYFIGEIVSSFDNVPEGFVALDVPKQKYAKFTTGPDSMPSILINAWTNIWKMTDSDFGGKRRYHTDFEVYDERASDHDNIVMDIMIGLED